MKKPNVVIVGLGLIGGSLALELQKRKLASRICGISTSAENRNEALRKKAVQEAYPKAGDFLKEADLIVVCTPVQSIPKILKEIKPYLSSKTLVTDVGSTKVEILKEAARLKIPQFLGSHPIAGTEKSGMKAAQLNLFKDKKWILTPSAKNTPAQIRLLSDLFRAIGAQVEILSANEHDELFAAFSHVPNLLSYALAASLNEKKWISKLSFSGTSLRDMTRLAESPVEMWRDIALSNASEILKSVARLEKKISVLKKALKGKSGKGLENILSEGQRLRKRMFQ